MVVKVFANIVMKEKVAMNWPSCWQGVFRCWPRWSGRRTRSWRRRHRGGRRRRQTWGLPRTRSLPPLFSKRKLAQNWTFFRKETGLPSSQLDLLLDIDISCDLKWYFVFSPVSEPEWHLVKWPQWGQMSWQLPWHFQSRCYPGSCLKAFGKRRTRLWKLQPPQLSTNRDSYNLKKKTAKLKEELNMLES